MPELSINSRPATTLLTCASVSHRPGNKLPDALQNAEDEGVIQKEEESSQIPTVRQSEKERHKPDYYRVWVNSVEECDPEPPGVTEALSSSEKKSGRKLWTLKWN